MSSSEIGKQGELLAKKFLQKNGHKVIDTNYHCRFGEIDIISTKSKELIFTEVKSRSSDAFGEGREFVTPEKIERMTKTAHLFIQNELKGKNVPFRFDVIEVYFESGKLVNLRHLQNVTL